MKSSFSFLADENIPLSAIRKLRKEGYGIISVVEEYKKASDRKILELSLKNKWVIVTFDKDFGELIYKQGCNKPFGIILLRVTPKSPKYILQILEWLLQTIISFEGNFVIVKEDKVRVIKL